MLLPKPVLLIPHLLRGALPHLCCFLRHTVCSVCLMVLPLGCLRTDIGKSVSTRVLTLPGGDSRRPISGLSLPDVVGVTASLHSRGAASYQLDDRKIKLTIDGRSLPVGSRLGVGITAPSVPECRGAKMGRVWFASLASLCSPHFRMSRLFLVATFLVAVYSNTRINWFLTGFLSRTRLGHLDK
ncbi:hypothetical protein BKA70DRAFT_583165 [Coprinopsis sp. MPI-PUGE-AT-0042]|nr:hypothetical protein BKA70DRAFT_583165 [Coprinopsis sp. MPI-PUGE-AT-0042]